MEQEKKLYIPASIADTLPSMVRNELAKLPAEKQEEFLEEYKRKAKSVGTAYVLFLLLGMHYGYLGKWGLQFAFWLTAGGFLIWWLVDLFRLPKLVNEHNKDVALEIMRNLKVMSS